MSALAARRHAATADAPAPGQVVAIYARKSKKVRGEAESITRQIANARAEAERHYPGVPVEVFSDNIPATDDTVVRLGYEQLLSAMRTGRVFALIVREQSRLTRDDWETFLATATANGVAKVHQYAQGTIDVTRDRLVSRIMAAVDKEEVERTRMRVNEALEDRRAKGLPKVSRVFGYRFADTAEGRTLVVEPTEATELRRAAARILGGWTMAAVCRDITEREVPTVLGGKWHVATLKRLLLAPTIYGHLAHRGEVIGRGAWEPILDADTEERLKAKLSAPVMNQHGKAATRMRNPVMRHLLTNIAKCGKCGAPMKGIATKKQGVIYTCVSAGGGCGRLSILHAGEVDALVVAEVLAVCRQPRLVAKLARDQHTADRAAAREAVEAVKARKVAFAVKAADGEMDPDEWSVMRARLDERLAEAERALAEVPPPPSDDVDLSLVPDAWGEMSLAERRRVITTVLAEVVILPAIPGNRPRVAERTRLVRRS